LQATRCTTQMLNLESQILNDRTGQEIYRFPIGIDGLEVALRIP
jgi:hypothetical protein